MISSWNPSCLVALMAITVSTIGLAQTATSAPNARLVLEKVTSADAQRDGITVHAGAATLRITALRGDILRVRIAAGSEFPEDASWAVLWEARTKSIEVKAFNDANAVGFRTASLDVRVERDPLRLVVRDLSGNIICADAVGRPV